MPKISKVEKAVPTIQRKLCVAAYARVSMESERMQNSLSTQVSFYSNLIQKNPKWEYAGVYADYGISGTGMKKRTEFQRMLQDAKDGKIDLILTKSIQRFARNTVDLLTTVRQLKDMGVEVWFEKENIRSMSGDGELMMSILASFAQEESRSISENIRWRIKKQFEQGKPNGHFNVYGYRWEGDKLVIVPEEAVIVKRIFQNFLDGKSRIETGREFTAKGIKTRGGYPWVDSNIKVILTNIIYTGNLLLQKEYISDPIFKHRKKNKGELPQYYVENTHEAIIDKETFDYVQSEMARRKALGPLANKALNTTCFTGKIKCGICGKSFMHTIRKRENSKEDYWVCGSHKHKGCTCVSKGVLQNKVLIKECTEVLGLTEFDEETFLNRVDKIVVPEHHVLVFHFKNGEEITRRWVSTARKDWWTPERRKEWGERHKKKSTNPNRHYFNAFTGVIKCGNCSENYRSQSHTYVDGEKERHWRCGNTCGNSAIKDSTMKRLVTDVLGMEIFNEEKMDELIDKAVIKNGTVTFYFKDGHTDTRIYKERKRGYTHTPSSAFRAYMSDVMRIAKSGDPNWREKVAVLKEEWRREDNRWQKQ